MEEEELKEILEMFPDYRAETEKELAGDIEMINDSDEEQNQDLVEFKIDEETKD
jgi:hypothetical protein